MYSWRQTNAAPDGIWGPITSGLARKVAIAAGFPTQSTSTYSDQFLRWLPGALITLTGNQDINQANPRLLPFNLPLATHQAVNTSIASVSTQGPWLQEFPS
jgi:hypothetical protein